MAEKETAGKKRRLGDMQLFWRRGVQYGEVDLPFFLIVIALLVMGIVMMFSASYAWAIAEGKEGSYYAVSQMKNAGLGLVLMLFLCMVDYHFFQKKLIAIGAYVLPLILLVMVFIPGIGVTDGGATRWIAIGSFNFQPSETMKIGMVIFYSYVITKNYDNMRYFLRGMLPMLLASLGAIFTQAGVGHVISKLAGGIIPKGNVTIGIVVLAVGMMLFTMVMGNAFAAITVLIVGIGAPFVLAFGANPAVVGVLALTCGYCGTLLTPMAANFNIVPVALLEMKDRMGVIRNQILPALVMISVQIVYMLIAS